MKSFLAILLLTFSLNGFAVDTADWMGELYESRPETRLVDIAIPGTHNSGTYNISYLSPIQPGQSFFFNLIKPIVASWSKTQFKTVYQQLVGGIRYLDVRIAFNKKGRPDVVHGMVSIQFKTLLNEISRFIDQHPKEIVLLTYKLEYDYQIHKVKPGQEGALIERLDKMVQNHFGNKLLPFSNTRTFADFWQRGGSVMILDDYDRYWSNDYDLGKVHAYLDQAIASKSPHRFSDLQMIFTPPVSITVFINPQYALPLTPQDNSLSVFSAPLRSVGAGWIKKWNANGYRPNIITTDFFDRFSFVRTILDLNQSNL